jgi:uncharacterized protein YigE (DUF2233 family)
MLKANRSLFQIFRLLLGFSYPVCFATAEEFEHVESSGKNFTVCHVDLDKERLELFLQNEKGATFKSFSTLDAWLRGRGRQLAFAMNAGMYHADYSPVGLYIENGRELSPLNLRNDDGNFFLKPNGVFAVTENGAQVVESSQFSSVKKSASRHTVGSDASNQPTNPSEIQCCFGIVSFPKRCRRHIAQKSCVRDF